ncbi:peptidase [Clostridium botulinum]|uniref:transglycosylase domain-containing protein n=1 Tax=Clostridium botulinum TaxID=1491 RepID=UPI0013F0AB67|nr:transglycosylase domain-containing protein [Clostridium botulinum]MBY6917215.1 transglycosylase domain-containing protein [Clostridium botulinum]NFH90391.1 peptidase [Clostridium botulinum]NFI18102.1 peptidase [Clostridium botulinum]NFI53576.1 peptidase [Clostridium botulinum]NFL93068.1 peptidase [Clostridium botulinum]
MSTEKTPNKTKKSTNKNTNNKRKKKKKRKNKLAASTVFKKIGIGFLSLILIVSVVGAGYLLAIIKTTPPLDVEDVLSLNQASSLYDDSEKFMDNLHTDEERYVITSDKIPANLKNAFISIEDERFFKHRGVDIQRILGAALTDVKKILTGQKGLHGASTITQQLIKNTVLTNEVSIKRKVKEIYLSLDLEEQLSKDQIITAYLNTIPLGGQVYGVEAASLLYFSKNTADLNLIECAYLAGITQAPSYYSAYNENNQKDPSRYINRTLTVLSKMKELGYISESDYNQGVQDINNGKLVFKSSKKDFRLNYEWFVYPAVSQVKRDLKEKYKYTDEEVSKLMVNGGLKIYTTMDRDLQNFTQKTLDNYKNLNVGNSETYDENKVPLLQASATITDYRNGKVLAMVGGRGKQLPQSNNRAYNDLRSIGSTTKPLTVYGPGIDQEIITAATSIDDAPLSPELTKKYPAYAPPNILRNSPDEYLGLISPREGIMYSKNTASVITADTIGLKTGISYGENLGLVFNSASKTSIATVALGQYNNNPNDRDGGNTYKLAAAFGSFGNDGLYVEPLLYTKVVDPKGNTVLEANPKEKQVFSPETAYIMYDLLKGPVNFYGGAPAKWSDMPVAGKTGTTTDAKDLWFAGLTPYLSGSIWVGYDNPKTVFGGSGTVCANLWGKIMAKAHEGMEVKDLDEPSGIVHVAVCKDSGKLPSSLCSSDPRGNRITEELFIEGTEPHETCNTHVSGRINRLNNKLAGANTPALLTQNRVFISKKYPNPLTRDYIYVLPHSQDNYTEDQANPELSPPNVNEEGEVEIPNNNGTPQENNPPPETEQNDSILNSILKPLKPN